MRAAKRQWQFPGLRTCLRATARRLLPHTARPIPSVTPPIHDPLAALKQGTFRTLPSTLGQKTDRVS